jgi:RNA polymerase sigma-70 factor (ECF subfamily)
VDDAVLVERARRGDARAFDELVGRYRRSATAVAVHLLGDVAGAEDVVQDAFAAAYRNLDALREPARFRSWFHTIVRRASLRGRRRSRRPEVLLEDLPEVGREEPALTPADERILLAINALPRCYREILAARYLSEMPYPDIAAMFGLSEGAVRVRVFRAKQRLRACLECAGRTAEASSYEM